MGKISRLRLRLKNNGRVTRREIEALGGGAAEKVDCGKKAMKHCRVVPRPVKKR